MYTIFGTTYYTHGFGLVFAFPFVIWFLISVMKATTNYFSKNEQVQLSSIALSASISLLVFAGVFLDVFLTGNKASELCKNEAGMHIYKKIEVEGLLGIRKVNNWSDFGIKFVEYETTIGKKYREFIENEKVKKIEIDNFQSEIELVREREKVTDRIIIGKKRMVNRQNSEVYSELVVIGIFPGWADSLFINLTGTSYGGWSCGRKAKGKSDKEYYTSDLVKATIIPKG